MPFISVCVPAYKNTPLLAQLFDSIAGQTYQDFELVVSDDSDNDDIRLLTEKYRDRLPAVHYHKPSRRLGMGGNWNRTLDMASGEWLKIMHDDDWFSGPDSLASFAAAAAEAGSGFIFSDYINFYEQTGREKSFSFPEKKSAALLKTPEILIAKNIVGNPSCTLVRRDIPVRYDVRMKWRIDIDYYIQILHQTRSFRHIARPLVHVGMNEQQMTNSVKLNPAVELPEAYGLLIKNGEDILEHIVVYDAYWRMFRNMQVFDKATLHQYSDQEWDKHIYRMIRDLGSCNPRLLRNGFYSKAKMFLSFTGRNK